MSVPSPKRILLGQLASNGDCLYATTLARQIKVDYPGCHLTWAIGPAFRSVIDGNPDVDEVWEVEGYGGPNDIEGWRRFEAEAAARKKRGEFGEVFLTQISPGNLHNRVGSVRASIFRSYPHPITVDTAPVLRLSSQEVENVQHFAAKHHLTEKQQVILFESSPRSKQSVLTVPFALDVARRIIDEHPEVAIIVSSNQPFESTHPNLIDGSVLSLRENAELTKYCTLLIGASSGITWIVTSDWAKPLPMLQLVLPDLARSNSLVYDYEKRGLDTSPIVEMNSYTQASVVECVGEILNHGLPAAKARFHQTAKLGFSVYRDVQRYLIIRGQLGKSLRLLRLNIEEYGFRIEFLLILVWVFLLCLFAIPIKIAEKAKQLVFRGG